MKSLACVLCLSLACLSATAKEAVPGTPAKVYRTLKEAHDAGVNPLAAPARAETSESDSWASGWVWLGLGAAAVAALALATPIVLKRLTQSRQQ